MTAYDASAKIKNTPVSDVEFHSGRMEVHIIHIRMNIMYVWPAHTSDSPLKDFICILRPFLPYD